MNEEHADDLLKRALIDAEASASVALRVTPLTLSEALTVVFHGRKDLGTIQTYVAHGGRGAGDAVGKDELMRVPCDLDLAEADDRAEAEHLFAEQAGALRDALVGADTVLDIWREPFEDMAHDHVRVDRRLNLDVRLPAPRLLPTALVAPRSRSWSPPCAAPARSTRAGRRWGSRAPSRTSCASTRSPTTRSAAWTTSSSSPPSTPLIAEQLGRQEASVQRFLELTGDDFPQTG